MRIKNEDGMNTFKITDLNTGRVLYYVRARTLRNALDTYVSNVGYRINLKVEVLS